MENKDLEDRVNGIGVIGTGLLILGFTPLNLIYQSGKKIYYILTMTPSESSWDGLYFEVKRKK